MYHFDKMPRAVRTDPAAARTAVRRSGADSLEDRPHLRPCRGGAAGHQARPVQRALFPAGNTDAEIELPLRLDIRRATDRVRKMRITAVDQNIPVIQQRQELLDHIVHSLPRFDHHEHPARLFEPCHQLFKRMAADDIPARCTPGYEVVRFFRRAVEHGHREASGFHVEGQILAHDGKADQADIRLLFHCPSLHITVPAPDCRRRRASCPPAAEAFPPAAA